MNIREVSIKELMKETEKFTNLLDQGKKIFYFSITNKDRSFRWECLDRKKDGEEETGLEYIKTIEIPSRGHTLCFSIYSTFFNNIEIYKNFGHNKRRTLELELSCYDESSYEVHPIRNILMPPNDIEIFGNSQRLHNFLLERFWITPFVTLEDCEFYIRNNFIPLWERGVDKFSGRFTDMDEE